MSTDKIPPKIDTVVILGCFLMADFDFQPHFAYGYDLSHWAAPPSVRSGRSNAIINGISEKY